MQYLFQPDLERDEDLQQLQEALVARFESVAMQLNSHRDQSLPHSHLWRESKQEALQRFLGGGDGGVEPSLSHFKSQVNSIIMH